MQLPRRRIFSAIATMMVFVLAYPLICSGICLLKTHETGKEVSAMHSCCAGESKPDDTNKNDCNDEHLAFNKAIGQFFKEREHFSYTASAIELPSFTLLDVISAPSEDEFYQFFDTGPPDSGGLIRIWIESFQI